jgi:hypothetical protein
MSWRSVLLVEETRVPEKTTDLPQVTWMTLSHYVVSNTPRLSGIWIMNPKVVIGTDCIGSNKSNYHTIMTKSVPVTIGKNRAENRNKNSYEILYHTNYAILEHGNDDLILIWAWLIL